MARVGFDCWHTARGEPEGAELEEAADENEEEEGEEGSDDADDENPRRGVATGECEVSGEKCTACELLRAPLTMQLSDLLASSDRADELMQGRADSIAAEVAAGGERTNELDSRRRREGNEAGCRSNLWRGSRPLQM